MRSLRKAHALGPFLAILLCQAVPAAAERITAKDFAGSDQILTEDEAALYVAHRDKESISLFLEPGHLTVDRAKLLSAMSDKLDDLGDAAGHDAPWSWQELDALVETPEQPHGWRAVRGVTAAAEIGSLSIGPIRLRRNADELKLSDVTQAKGALIGFSDNFLIDGGGVWNTEGALGYPVTGEGSYGARKVEASVGPSIEWKLAQSEEADTDEIEELTIGLPAVFYLYPASASSSLWIVDSKPYMQTDFSGGHEIYGWLGSVEYVGAVFGSPVFLGGFQNFGTAPVQYQLRIVPNADYSATEATGPHSSRKHSDDWFRLGGKLSFDLRTTVASAAFDVGASYGFLGALSGSGGYSDLFIVYAELKLGAYVGLKLQYSKGETPVADKAIDLITFGPELKY